MKNDSTLPAGLRLRGAVAADADDIRQLLTTAGLGDDDVGEVVGRFIVGDGADEGLLGCVALDGAGRELLLRSLVVRPSVRGIGLGRLLVDAALLDAWGRRARRVVLVTETAEGFFAGAGFQPVTREDVSAPLLEHRQFSGACPDSATVMALDLTRFG